MAKHKFSEFITTVKGSVSKALRVKDEDTSERLDSIEGKLDSIINDGAAKVQVTGSNVEDEDAIPVKSTKRLTEIKNHEDVDLIGGGSFYLTEVIRTGDFGNVTLLLRWANGKVPTKFDFKISYYHKSHPSIVTIEDVHSSDEIGNEIKLKSPYFRVLITNRGDTEAEIRTAIVVGG